MGMKNVTVQPTIRSARPSTLTALDTPIDRSSHSTFALVLLVFRPGPRGRIGTRTIRCPLPCLHLLALRPRALNMLQHINLLLSLLVLLFLYSTLQSRRIKQSSLPESLCPVPLAQVSKSKITATAQMAAHAFKPSLRSSFNR